MDLNEILGKIVQENKLDNLSNFNDLYVMCRKNGYEKNAEEFVSEIKHIFNDALNDYVSVIDDSKLKDIAGGKLDFKKILSMPIAMLTLTTPFVDKAKALTPTDAIGVASSFAVDTLLPKPKKSSTLPGIVKLLGLVVGSGVTVGVIYKVVDYCKKIYDSKNLGECVNNFVEAVKDGELTGSDIYQCYTNFVKKATGFLGKNENINLPEDIKDVNQLQKAYDSLKSFVKNIPGKSKELINNALEALKTRLDAEKLKQQNINQQQPKIETKNYNLNQNEHIQHENNIIALITDTTKEISEKIQQKQAFDLKYIGEKVVDICYETFLHAVIKGKSEQKDIPNKQDLSDEMSENVRKNKYDKVLNLVKFENWHNNVKDNFEQKDLLKQSLDNLLQKCNEWKNPEILEDNQDYNEYEEDFDNEQFKFYDENDYEEENMDNQDNTEFEDENTEDMVVSVLKKITKYIDDFTNNPSDYGEYNSETEAHSKITQNWDGICPDINKNYSNTWYCKNIMWIFNELFCYLQENSNEEQLINYSKEKELYYSNKTFKELEDSINLLVQNQASENIKNAWKDFLNTIK